MADIDTQDLVKERIATVTECGSELLTAVVSKLAVVERRGDHELQKIAAAKQPAGDDAQTTAVVTTPAKGVGTINDRRIADEKPDSQPARGDAAANGQVISSAASNGNANARKRHRRNAKGGRHHRKWRPYTTLTWDERRVVDERETRRACQKREQRIASGQPMAPYNTTQFLMEQHDTTEPMFAAAADHAGAPRPRRRTRSGQGGGSGSESSPDEPFDSADEADFDDSDDIAGGETFLEREFSEAYENVHAERLQNMTKDDLVREYIELEARNQQLERLLRFSGTPRVSGYRHSFPVGRDVKSPTGDKDSDDVAAPLSRVNVLFMEGEIQRLQDENSRLKLSSGNSTVNIAR